MEVLELGNGRMLTVVQEVGGENSCLICICEERLLLGFEVVNGFEGYGVVFRSTAKGGEFVPLRGMVLGRTLDEVVNKLVGLSKNALS